MTQLNDHLNPDTLSAFIDGELAPAESQAVQQHLATCHPCALQVISATRLKTATARAGRRFTPSQDALARLTAQLKSEPAKQIEEVKQHTQSKSSARLLSFRPAAWAWSALAACLILGISLFGWQQTHHADALSAELLDQHLATLSPAASPQVISTDRHTVKPWFQGKLPFSFNLPDPLPADTVLKGGDLAYLDGQPAALLLFTIHKHEVSVFLTQRAGSLISARLPGVRSGFSMHTATTHDLRIVAVSDVNPSDLDMLLSALEKAQAPQ